MKCQLLKLIEMSDYQTVRDLIAGYMHHYNEKAYQYDLAGLTPAGPISTRDYGSLSIR